MSLVAGVAGCPPAPIVPGPRSQTGRPCFPPGMHKRACTDTLEPKLARTVVEGADIVPRQPLLVWHDSQTASQVSRKLQLELAKSGGKSATSGCISDPSDSEGIEINSTWRRGAILTTQIRTWGPVRVAPGVGFAYLITDASGHLRATTEIAGTNRSFRALFRFSLRPNRGPGPSNHADGRPWPPTSGGEALS